jgi:hypothetical protein
MGSRSVAPPRARLTGFVPHNKAALSFDNRGHVQRALLDGYPLAAIAKALRISTPTLKRLMAADPELQAEVEAQRSFEETELRDILMELARKGDTVAAIFLTKARHGWRDRDDAKALRAVEDGKGGVLLIPSPVPLDEWEAACARQQAPHRERLADEPAVEYRTRTDLGDGMYLEQVLPGDLSARH